MTRQWCFVTVYNENGHLRLPFSAPIRAVMLHQPWYPGLVLAFQNPEVNGVSWILAKHRRAEAWDYKFAVELQISRENPSGNTFSVTAEKAKVIYVSSWWRRACRWKCIAPTPCHTWAEHTGYIKYRSMRLDKCALCAIRMQVFDIGVAMILASNATEENERRPSHVVDKIPGIIIPRPP